MPTVHESIQANHLGVMQVMVRLSGPEFSPEVARLLSADFNPNGLPFDAGKWAIDPAPISQMKKIVNALYHVEQIALIVDEKRELGLRGIWSDVSSVQHHLYQALYLLTHLDADFHDLFRQELAELMPLKAMALSYVTNEAGQIYLNKAHQMGELTGCGVTQLSQMNYTFLTQLGLLLPSYLASIKTKVDAYATDAPPVRADMDAPSLPLFNNRLYLDYFQPLFALQTDILNELSDLKSSSAHVIQEKLRTFRDLFSRVVACVDELEIALALRPGQLSERLVDGFRPMHQQLVDRYNGLELDLILDADVLSLEGAQFTTTRLEQAFRRWAEEELAGEHIEDVQEQCCRFFDALSTHDPATRLSQLDEAVKQTLIEPFRLIQPYLATIDIKLSNVIAKSLMERAEPGYFDRFYSWTAVRQITDYSDRLEVILKARDAVNAHALKKRNTHLFRQRLNINFINTLEITDEFDERCEAALRVCREHAARNAIVAPEMLAQDLDAERRATHVLKTTLYSDTVANIRQQMASMLGVLHPAVQLQLQSIQNTTGSLPFPEINKYYFYSDITESIEGLKQPTQLLGFKQLANALYFLEQSCRQLEYLDEMASEKGYILLCARAARYAGLAAQTFMALQEEPYFLMLSDELRSALNESISGILALKLDYSPDYDHDAVFSLVNALTLLPQQRDAGLQRLDQETVDAAHLVAQDVSDEMRRILASFHHAGFQKVLSLFLEIPAALVLLQGIAGKVHSALRAARDSHGEAIDNLGLIYRDLLMPILLEVEQWEEKLNLQPGLLSRPMKQMLDTYYQGLLKPLSLSTNRRIELVSHLDAFLIRQEAAAARLEVARLLVEELANKKTRVDAFVDELYAYSWHLDVPKGQVLLQNFQAEILPILREATLPCQALYSQVDLNGCLNMDSLGVNQGRTPMLRLLEMRQADLIGEIESQSLVREVATAKIKHLGEQLPEQATLHDAFKRKCIVESLSHQSLPLKGVGVEYDQALTRYIHGLEASVFARVERSADIDSAILAVLTEKMRDFEAQQGFYYRQLVAIQNAVNQMNAYMVTQQAELILNAHVGFSSGFESQATLSAKRALLEEVEGFIANQGLSVQARVAGIHAIIHRNGFETTLLAYENYDAFTYGWLVQCVTSFLELICLYKPEPKVAYERLTAEIGFFRPPAGGAAVEPPGPELAMGV